LGKKGEYVERREGRGEREEERGKRRERSNQ